MYRESGLVLAACLASILAYQPNSRAAEQKPALSRAKATEAELPLRFEPNQGRWDSSVKYAAHAGGFTLALTERGASLYFAGAKSRRIDISLLNAKSSPEIEGTRPLGFSTNYFVGKREDWRTGVPNYSAVRYHGVYPGIDLVYYGNQGQLEYDFILQPGAEPGKIRMRFSGVTRLQVTPEGDLAIESPEGRIVQKKPVTYQEDPETSERREIAAHYVLISRGVAGLRLDSYDRSQRLVVDPTLMYSSFFGGSQNDTINAVTMGPNGLLYFTGYTSTSDMPATQGAFASADGGSTQNAIMGIIDTSAAGGFNVVYLTYYGGSGTDIATSITLDNAGNVYIAGSTTSTNLPLEGANVQTTLTTTTTTTGTTTGQNGFVAVFTPAGQGPNDLIYATYLGGSGVDVINGIAVGPGGLVYVIGTTTSPDFPVTTTAYQVPLWGPSDSFLAQFSLNSPTLLYSTYLGGEGDDDGRAIVVTPNGLVYFAISTLSQEFPLAGPTYQGSPQGGYDIIVGAMDMSQPGVSSLVYSTYFGGSGNEEVRDIALDANGHLVLTGYTYSQNFPITSKTAVQATAGPNGDAFVAVVDPTAAYQSFLLYSTYLGGSQNEVGYGVLSDRSGNLWVTGYTLSPDFPVTQDAIQGQYGYGVDLFISEINPNVSGAAGLLFSTYFGATGVHSATSLTQGPDGTIYMGGYTSSLWTLTNNAFQSGYGGGAQDGFVVAIGGFSGTSNDRRSEITRAVSKSDLRK
jgi:Beta-propeller repeat